MTSRLNEWLNKDDEPVVNGEGALFSRQADLERLCRLITDPTVQSILLGGDRGSGKTSLFNTARKKLHDRPLLWANVSAWGFIDAASVTEDLLAEILRSLSRQVNIVPFRHLPRAYAAGIEFNDDAWWRAGMLSIFPIFDRRGTLRKLNDVLHTIERRMVVFVDDLERWASDSGQSEEHRRQVEALTALILEFRGLDMFTVIFANSEL